MKPVDSSRLGDVNGGTRDCTQQFEAVRAAKRQSGAAFDAWSSAYEQSWNDPSKATHLDKLRQAEGAAYSATQKPWDDLQACLGPERK